MIIKKLTMNNFGVYAGKNVFEFSHTKPIVLIGGMNGRGKTTFLEAILLALYGSNSAGYKESRYKTYGTYLRSYVNKNHLGQTTSVELEFIMNESTNSEYMIHREWDALSKRTEETITVFENRKYSEFLTKNWAMFIENILPSELSRFFFFDGEKIAELAGDETNIQMKESIRSMLGISVLDVLKKDLIRTIKCVNKRKTQDNSSDSLAILRRKKEELEESLAKSKEELALVIERVEKQRTILEELHNQYKIKGGDVIEQRKSLVQRRSNLLAEIEQNRNALLECAASELPLSLVKGYIIDIKLQAEDEHNDLIMQQAIGMIQTMLKDYSITQPEYSGANQNFIDYIKKLTDESATDAVYQVSDHALFQLNSLLDTLLEQSLEHTRQILKKKKALQQELDEVDGYLSLDINERAMSELFTNIREQEDTLVQFEIQVTTLKEKQNSIERALVIANSEYGKAVDTYLQQAEFWDEAERMTKYTDIALTITEAFSVELQRRKSGMLGEVITECYKKLANKKNHICNIVMNPETLDITYLDNQEHEIQKESLSAGEKQLMVIAILWALAICSKKKLPVIIDTPLSRLDSMHRTSMVTVYFPQASDQTIILSTDSEIDQYYYDLMKEYIGDEFTLCYDEETKSTTITKGYFQG